MSESFAQQIWSRRTFARSTAALALAHSAFGDTLNSLTSSKKDKLLVYVGTYTSAADGSAHGKGIYLSEMDPNTGELSGSKLVAKTPNPTWLVIHPSKKYLYAMNEVDNYQGNNGSVTAFSIDAATGDLALMNSVSSAGAGPAHMSLDARGKFAFVANYGGGSIAVLSVLANGSLGPAVDVHLDTGSVGSKHATNAPKGSFAVSGHDQPHAHMIAPDPTNKFVLATDLAQDRLYVYRLDAATGKLTPAATPFASLPTGDGPRHFAFHPNGRWLYLLQEEASTIAFFHFDPETGALAAEQSISALPTGFAGTNFAAEIAVSPDGKFLYSSNRLHDTICICSIGVNGRIQCIGEASTLGSYPRHFAIDPSGNFVYACNQKSDSITVFRRNRTTGLLTATGFYAAVGSPAALAFLT